jgi:hypothetical protein
VTLDQLTGANRRRVVEPCNGTDHAAPVVSAYPIRDAAIALFEEYKQHARN